MEDPIVPLERKSVRSSFGKTDMEKAIWENPIETWLGENSKLGMSLCTPWKIILICVWMTQKNGWKETKQWSYVESIQLRSWFGRTNIFCGSCLNGVHSKTMWNKQGYCWQLQNHVWIQNFSKRNWKITMLGNLVYFLVVMRYGKSCQRMCGTKLWAVKQGRLNISTKCPLHALMTIMSKKKKNWNPWENCQKYALKLFWNAETWHVLEDLIFYGQWTNLHDRSQNGPRLVTKDDLVWSLTFIIHVNTISIAIWETMPNNADWDCFKTLASQEILKIRNPLLEEHYAFLEVIHLFQ